MQKFTFNNPEKTEIRHNIVPEFLIEVIRLDAPNDYGSAGLYFSDLFDEISIRGWHFVFKMKGGELVEDEEDVWLYRSICRRAAKWYKAQVAVGLIPLEKFVFKSGHFEDDNFKLMKSDEPNWWLVAHKPTRIIVEFESGKFNETQKVANLEDVLPDEVMRVATAMREVGEWLVKHHQKLL